MTPHGNEVLSRTVQLTSMVTTTLSWLLKLKSSWRLRKKSIWGGLPWWKLHRLPMIRASIASFIITIAMILRNAFSWKMRLKLLFGKATLRSTFMTELDQMPRTPISDKLKEISINNQKLEWLTWSQEAFGRGGQDTEKTFQRGRGAIM